MTAIVGLISVYSGCLESGCSKTGLVRKLGAILPIGCMKKNVQNLNSELHHETL